MTDIEHHVDAVIAFNKRLTDGGVDEQVAGVCTIEFNKALLQHNTPSAAASSDERRQEIRLAAERKSKERAEALAKAQS